MTQQTRRWAGIVSASCLALALTACGGGSSGAGPTASPDPATGTASATATGTADGPVKDATDSDLAVGDRVSVGSLREHIDAALVEAGTAQAVLQGVTLTIGYDVDRVDFATDGDPPVTVIDGAVFVKAEGPLAEQAEGRGWLRLDPESEDEVVAYMLEGAGVVGAFASPTPLFGPAGGTATLVNVTGDLVAYEIVLTGEDAATVAAEIFGDRAEAMDDVALFVQVQVDPQGHPIQLWVHDGDAVIEAVYSQFGAPPPPQAPAADDVLLVSTLE